jgi:hypothetical protein
VDAISLFVKDSRSLLKVAILQAMLTTRRMRIVSIYQIAQTKLSTECDQAGHNLRLVVGHTNLLNSLLTRLTDLDDETQRFLEELTTLKTEKDGCNTNSKPISAIST